MERYVTEGLLQTFQAELEREERSPATIAKYLRHLFACQYYQEVKDLSRLADILGHTNVNTTRIYTRASRVEQRRQMECLGLVLGEGKRIPHNVHYEVMLFPQQGGNRPLRQ